MIATQRNREKYSAGVPSSHRNRNRPFCEVAGSSASTTVSSEYPSTATTERAELSAKMQSIRGKAFNNFYNNVLPAEQRAKYDELRASGGPGPRMGGWGNGFSRRGRGW